MTSIRPLATITVLAAVGVFLYMKISDTETVLPDEVAGWQLDEDLKIEGDFDTPSPAPQFTTQSQASAAPPLETPSAPLSAPLFDHHATAATAHPTPSDLPPLPTLAPSPPPEVPAAYVTTEPAAPAFVASSAAVPAPPAIGTQPAQSPFSATRLAAQAALDRGELSQALLLLSDWYGDPSLLPNEVAEVQQLLGQLAGSVIYSTEHRLEPPYMVQAGERLEDIAQKYQVPWQLLAKINGISQPAQIQPGQQLKVLQGPFSAMVDFSQRKLTLMLDRRYAGEFAIEIDPAMSVEEGHWSVNQKLLTPGDVGLAGVGARVPTDRRSLVLASAGGGASQLAILTGSRSASPVGVEPAGRVIRLKTKDVGDVFDILSLGSLVVIRR